MLTPADVAWPAPPGMLAVVVAPFVGSFAGSLALRLPEGRGVVFGRSACPACDTPLSALDLVPLFSWVITRGHCRHCQARVSGFYPAIELAAAAVALWAALTLGGWQVWIACGLGWSLLALAAADIRYLILPDALTLPLLLAGLAVGALVEHGDMIGLADVTAFPGLTARLVGAVAGFAAFWAVAAGYRRWRGHDGLGLGDAKLLAAAGAWVGWRGLPSVVLLAALVGLAAVLAASLLGRTVARDQPLPFGACLAAALWWVFLHGPLAFG